VPAFNDAVRYMAPQVMRYPGGLIANLFDWKRTVARFPQSGKKQIVSVAAGVPCTFGLHEALTWAASQGMEPTYVFGIATASVQDAADLVEYLNAPNDGSNWGGGEDLAKKRAENGHPDPFHVHFFELGNEPYLDPSIADEKYWLAGTPVTGSPSDEEEYAFGGTVEFKSQLAVTEEDWSAAAAASNGKAEQRKYTRYHPVVDSRVVTVGGVAWTEVADIQSSPATATHYQFNAALGEILFGDGVHGKIPPSGARIAVSYRTARPGFDQFYAAMKAVDPSIAVYSSYSTQAFVAAMSSNHPYDGLVMHQYPTNYETIDDRRHNAITLSVDAQTDLVRELRKQMRDAVGDARAPAMNIAITEFSLYAGAPDTFPTDYLRSLDAAMYNAQQLTEYMKLGIEYAHRHTLVDGLVGLNGRPDFALMSSPNFVISASAQLYHMFDHMFGSTLVDSAITGNPVRTIWSGATVPYLYAVASKDDSGNVYVLVVNRDQANVCSATIRFDGAYVPSGEAEIWQIWGASYKSFNDIYHPNDVTLTTSARAVTGTELDYDFPAHSITAFRFHL
jgi:alpha-L-arabinofuranosidase